MVHIEVDDAAVRSALARLVALGQDLRPVMQKIAGVMHDAVEENFAQQGRPRWPDLRPSTLRRRRDRGKSAKILQDSGRLAGSIRPDHGPDYAQVSTNVEYARIQHFGGTIERAPHSIRLRHRTDAKGNLLRQGKNGRLLIFAKDEHKRARTKWAEVKPYRRGRAGARVQQRGARGLLMQLVSLVERLREIPELKSNVAGMASYLRAVDAGLRSVPAAFVVPLNETAGANPYGSQIVQQAIAPRIGVILAVQNKFDATGGRATDDVEALRVAVRTKLLGWAPGDGLAPLEFGGGGLLDFDDTVLFWQDDYVTQSVIRSV
jgi:phage virion morphogenesis protein